MSKKRILIVDDHGELRKLVRMTLEFEDMELHEADNGVRALELMSSVTPDVVILDVMMPGNIDGYQVCEKIKSNSAYAGTRVILLTARGQKADLEQGLKSGADAYMVKPFSPLALIEEVQK